MLKERILSTLRFFDLQDYPLTLLELHEFLLADLETIKANTDSEGEIVDGEFPEQPKVSLENILECLENECQGIVENTLGFCHLPGRKEIVDLRLQNYFYGIQREKRIKKFIGGLKRLPFVRGVGLTGSQAFGQQKETSDIDLFIVTDSRFMWLARTFVTAYFQILGKRRHGAKITNRFCLNHYVAGQKKIQNIKNLYSAMEYAKLRPLVYGKAIAVYQQNNSDWINVFFPNWQPSLEPRQKESLLQGILEKILGNGFGLWLEKKLKSRLLPRIKTAPFIIVEDDELSFHPDSKQKPLLAEFYSRTF
jgi:hypothetical protein